MTSSARAGLKDLVDELPNISLEAVIRTADLQTRVDRKYLVPFPVFKQLIEMLGSRLTALDIGGLRVFDYESIYFDTPRLTAYRQHAHGRRRRFKVRTRAYIDSDECVLEVKTEGGRGQTVKERLPYAMGHRHVLTAEAQEFVTGHLRDSTAVTTLTEVVTTAYSRSTLVDPVGGNRLTCDVDMCFFDRVRESHGPPHSVLIESKTVGVAAFTDVALWQLGQRPLAISKYCVGMALLRPELPANRWNRELRTHFGWQPRRLTIAQVGHEHHQPLSERVS